MVALTDARAVKPPGLKALKNNPTLTGCKTANRPYLKAVDLPNKTVYFIQPDCKLWSCSYCALRRKNLWRAKAHFGGDALLKSGSELFFVTLTSHELVRSVNAGVNVWRKAWPKLSARWRRKAPGSQYLYMGEHKQAQNFHVHMITTAAIGLRWYKDNARTCGMGYEADVSPIVDGLECAGYVGKYLAKAIAIYGWPPYWRRVNTSRNWPKMPEPQTPYAWSYIGTNYQLVLAAIDAYAWHGWVVSHALNFHADTYD